MAKSISPFKSTPNILSGEDAYYGLRSIEGLRGLAIISKSLSNRSQIIDNINKHSKCSTIKYITPTWSGEPKISELNELFKSFEDFQPDLIFIVGGGGVIDAVKISRILYEYPNLFAHAGSTKVVRIPTLTKTRTVIIPTTIGSGSETSSATVIGDQDGSKMFFICDCLIADTVILDPSTIIGLPKRIKLHTMCDALSHSIESYISKISNPIAEDYSIWALSKISKHWESCLKEEENLTIILEMQLASLYAGFAQNNMLVGAAHALAHAYSKYGLSHGEANAIFLKDTIMINSEDPQIRLRYEKLTASANISGGLSGLQNLTSRMRDKYPLSIPKSGLIEQDYALALNDPGGRANPRDLSVDLLKKIEKCAI